jgi:prepilin-type N-terminal cleavage/methylation domain-containing protein
MKKNLGAFTLVELIVVITILAILGTIAFISLQGYSQDAKNSKVSSDLRTLISAIETASAESNDFGITDLVTNT